MGHTVRRCPQAEAGPKVGKLIDTGDEWQTGQQGDEWNTGNKAVNDSVPHAAVYEANGQDDDDGTEEVTARPVDW